MFVPYWYEMSGCWLPWIATVAFSSALSLFTYWSSMWMFGFCCSNSSAIRLIELYSNDWFSGGGGVYPIHITRLIWPPPSPPLPPSPFSSPPEVHAAATSASTSGTASQIRLIRFLRSSRSPSRQDHRPRQVARVIGFEPAVLGERHGRALDQDQLRH